MKRQDSVRARIEIYSKVHYPGWQVKRVSPDPMCDGSPAFEASLARHGYQPIALIFTPRGEFVQLEEDIPFANVPSEVRAAATSAYRTYHISHTVERLTLASGEVQYLFDLSKGRVSKEATFDQHGSMICEH